MINDVENNSPPRTKQVISPFFIGKHHKYMQNKKA
jgi:hypothetical protein